MPNKKKNTIKTVEAIRHDEPTRKNIPTAEYQSVMRETEVGDRESGLKGQKSEDGGQCSRVRYRVSEV